MGTILRGSDNFDSAVSGSVIQVANYTTGALATGTTTIQADNTIPQITEGTQFMSLAFTPKKANSKLDIRVTSLVSNSVTGAITIALFKDSNANALGTISQQAVSSNSFNELTFSAFVDAVDTSSHTFTVRIGGSSAGTVTFNGVSGTAYYGGSLASSTTITEIAQ